MVDLKKIDTYFYEDSKLSNSSTEQRPLLKHSRFVKLAKLALPSIAAVLIVLLLLFPSLRQDARDFKLDITRPKQGELEKLHVENTVFYITDKDNKVNNFIASNIDETSPGSKLIKLSKPEGILPLDKERWINIKAPIGFFNQTNNLLELKEQVEMFYSEGMNVITSSAFFDFNNSKGYGNKPIKGQGFLGDLEAEGFEFSTKDDILIFKGHNDITIKEESFSK